MSVATLKVSAQATTTRSFPFLLLLPECAQDTPGIGGTPGLREAIIGRSFAKWLEIQTSK